MKHVMITLAFVFSILLVGCKGQNKTEPMEEHLNALVLYYSQTGATKCVAEQLKNYLNADIEAIQVEDPYSGSYDETIQRCIKESEENIVPKILPLKSNIDEYDVVFLGYPIWFGTFARPIMGLAKAYNMDGVNIVPFCTFGSGGLEASTENLKQAFPEAVVSEGYGVRNARLSAMPEELQYFLIEGGYMEGAVQKLPEFSDQVAVTDGDVAIFDEACGDYQFPLGTPVTVGKRITPQGEEYRYVANSKDMAGNDIQSTIYVLVGTDEDAMPQFTRVVR